jgi:hypothetical protein
VCDPENLKYEEAMTRVGSQRHRKKMYRVIIAFPKNSLRIAIRKKIWK